MQVFTELKNLGVEAMLIAVCDCLKRLLEAINTAWEQAVVLQCIVHLIRNSFRYAGRQPEQTAKDRFEEFAAE